MTYSFILQGLIGMICIFIVKIWTFSGRFGHIGDVDRLGGYGMGLSGEYLLQILL